MNEETKYCTGCEQMLSIDDFYKNRSKPDGLQVYCKICCKDFPSREDAVMREYMKEYFRDEEIRVKHNEKTKRYYQENRENLLENAKQYHQANRERINARSRKYRQEHREELNEKQRLKYHQRKMENEVSKAE